MSGGPFAPMQRPRPYDRIETGRDFYAPLGFKRKPTKYIYLYVLQGHYVHGWEDLAAEDKADPGALKRIRQTRREYLDNEGGTYRIISRRALRHGGRV